MKMKTLFLVLAFTLCHWPWAAQAAESKAEAYFNYMSGLRAESKGAIEEAKKAFEASAVLDKTATEPLKELINIAIHQKRLEEAEKWSEEALSRSPKEIDLQVLLAKIYINQKKYSEAEGLLKEILSQVGDDEEVNFLLGNLYLKRGDAKGAIAAFKRLAHGSGRQAVMARFFLGRLYTTEGELEKAEEVYKALLEDNPHLSYVYKYLSRIYQAQGRMADAKNAYEALLVNHPRDAEALRELLELYLELGEFEAHRGEFDRFLLLLDQSPKEGLRLVPALADHKRYDEALEVLDNLSGAFEDTSPVEFYKALVYEDMGKEEKYLLHLKRIQEGSSFYYPAMLRLAMFKKKQAGPLEAARMIEPLISREDASKDIFIVLSSFYEDANNRFKAREVLEEAAKRFKGDKEISIRLAIILEELKMRDQAIEIVKRILKEDPEYVPALNFLGYVYAEKGEHLDEAQKLVETALAKRPDDGYIMDSLGWVFYKKGEYKKALATIQRAMRLAPGDSIITEHLGDCLFALGHYYKAIKTYRKAIKLLKEKEKGRKAKLLKKINEARTKMEGS